MTDLNLIMDLVDSRVYFGYESKSYWSMAVPYSGLRHPDLNHRSRLEALQN